MTTLDPPRTAWDAPMSRDVGGWLRLVGGILFGSGALVLLFREQGDWSDWAKFAALAVPALVLFAVALPARIPGGARGWQSAFLIFGTLLLLSALLQFVMAVGGDTNDQLHVAWTTAAAAAVAIATSFVRGAPYQMLLGGVLLIATWLSLWDKILDNPSLDTIRWLLLGLAVFFLTAAVVLARARRPQASDLITVAGITAVLAGAFGAASVLSLGQLGSLDRAPSTGEGWNVFLLVVSLLLIGYGSRARTRGPAYVGAIGLTTFIYVTGYDLFARLKGEEVGGVVGWPLILLIGGAVALVASFVLRPRDGDGEVGSSAPAAPAGGAPAYAQPAAPGYEQPAYGQPPAAPLPPPPGQPRSLLDEWRREPPPGPGPSQ
jgi:hypothetical protein